MSNASPRGGTYLSSPFLSEQAAAVLRPHVIAPFQPVGMDCMTRCLQEVPRPAFLSDPIEAILQLLDELHFERNVGLLHVVRFPDGSEEVCDFNLGQMQRDSSFLPLYRTLENLEREAHASCGQIGINPQEVRDVVDPAAGMIRTLLCWPRLLNRIKEFGSGLATDLPQFGHLPEVEAKRLRAGSIIGWYWIEEYDPIRRRLLHFWDYYRGRMEPSLPNAQPSVVSQPGEGRARAFSTRGEAVVPPASSEAPSATGSAPDGDPPPAASPAPERTEGGPPAEPQKRRFTQDETNAMVADWFRRQQNEKPEDITRDRIAADTGASTGGVSKSPMWIAFSEKKKTATTPAERTVSLTDEVLAAVPGEADMPDELAALIEEQTAEEAEDRRRHERRHSPS